MHFFFTLFFSGFGMGLFTTSAAIYTMLHFDKYRATALSLLYGVGWGLSGIIGQLILSGLMEKYGFRGAVLLVGGIMMHSIPIVMLAKNPSPMCIGCKWCKSTSVDNQESGMHGARSEENVTNPG